ncbi:MAG TPA: glycosyltransferase [Caldilineaceae bacterium]|nr:glycosyltransferase [Caldilineaceae bacterium]
MRALCLSAQLPGHLDWGGYLETAAELVRRGHRLLWASGPAVQPIVEAAGVPFHPLSETGWRWPPPPPLADDPGVDPHALRRQKQRRALDQWLDPARVAPATEELHALVEQFHPDLILSEMFVAAAGLVAEAARRPLAVMGWPAPAAPPAAALPGDDLTQAARARLQELLGRFGLDGRNWTAAGPPALCSPHLHISYWSPSWFTGVALGAQTVHVGGRMPARRPQQTPDPALPPPDGAPWVLITLGTSFNRDPNFFVAASHAAEQIGCLPLIAVGAPLTAPWVQAMRPRLARSSVLAARLDFAAVLPFVAAAIHHGGAGTTHALIRHAIPQIVVPHAGDQVRQAQGLLRTGAGLYLPAKEVTVPRLVAGLAEALPDRSPLRAQAQALQAEFDALGGSAAAADQLEALMARL